MAGGVVIESELDKGRGPIAQFALIQKGTLVKGDAFCDGIHFGRVRDLFNERGEIVEKAGPSKARRGARAFRERRKRAIHLRWLPRKKKRAK